MHTRARVSVFERERERERERDYNPSLVLIDVSVDMGPNNYKLLVAFFLVELLVVLGIWLLGCAAIEKSGLN